MNRPQQHHGSQPVGNAGNIAQNFGSASGKRSVVSEEQHNHKQRLEIKLRPELGGQILSLLTDDRVEDICLNPDSALWVQRRGEGFVQVGEMAPTQALTAMSTIAAWRGTVINYERPILETELPIDGSRFEGLMPPVVRQPVFAIRLRPRRVFTLEEYSRAEILTEKDDQRNRLRAHGNFRQSKRIIDSANTAPQVAQQPVVNMLAPQRIRKRHPSETLALKQRSKDVFELIGPDAESLEVLRRSRASRVLRAALKKPAFCPFLQFHRKKVRERQEILALEMRTLRRELLPASLSPATYGHADSTTSMVVLKPLESGLDTNLLVTTDRRAYYFRLMSKPRDYVARVAFSYPDEENSEKWKQHMVQQQIAAKESDREAKMLPAMLTVDKLNFSYKVSGGTDNLRPVRVFDDGAKTYIQMRPEIQNRDVPALLIKVPDGKGQLTNYRIQQQTYIVDRLFDRARLVLGKGRKAQKVEITREQTPRG